MVIDSKKLLVCDSLKEKVRSKINGIVFRYELFSLGLVSTKVFVLPRAMKLHPVRGAILSHSETDTVDMP